MLEPSAPSPRCWAKACLASLQQNSLAVFLPDTCRFPLKGTGVSSRSGRVSVQNASLEKRQNFLFPQIRHRLPGDGRCRSSPSPPEHLLSPAQPNCGCVIFTPVEVRNMQGRRAGARVRTNPPVLYQHTPEGDVNPQLGSDALHHPERLLKP